MDMVYNLVRRELIFIKSTLKLQAIISLFFIIFFPLCSPSLGFMGIIVVPYFLLYGSMAYEEKSKTQLLVATLPVSSTQLCLSKYALGLLYIIVSILVSMVSIYLGQFVFPTDALRSLVIQNIGIMATTLCIMGLIYIAIILPILLKLGTEKTRYLMLLLYGLVFAVVPIIGKLVDSSVAASFMSNLNPVFFMLIGLIIYVFSLLLSISICMKKEY